MVFTIDQGWANFLTQRATMGSKIRRSVLVTHLIGEKNIMGKVENTCFNIN